MEAILRAPGVNYTIPCPLCEAPCEVVVSASCGTIDDIEVQSTACGHDAHVLVDSLGFNDALCELARAKWEDR